jgi:leucyl-tRNA synthetase
MEFLNTWEQSTVSAPLSAEDISACIRITAPFAPFLAEELWDNWSKQYSVAVAGIQSVHLSSWPSWDAELAQEEFATLAVQINGKVRAELRVSQAQLADEVAILAQAQALPELQKYLAGAQIKKTIYVPGKILSIVLNT